MHDALRSGRPFVPMPGAPPGGSVAMGSILSRASRTQIREDPFPHLVVPDALPADAYRALIAAFPSDRTVIADKRSKPNQAYRLPACRVIDDPNVAESGRAFFRYHTSRSFFEEVVAFWRSHLVALYGSVDAVFGRPAEAAVTAMRMPGRDGNPANQEADLTLECQFVINTPATQSSSVRGPHIDNPSKLFAALLYCRSEDDETDGGDLDLYRVTAPGFRFYANDYAIDAAQIERTATIRYAPNTLVMWLNSVHAVHGVSPRAATARSRRYINLIGERFRSEGAEFFECPVRSPDHRRQVSPSAWFRKAVRSVVR